MPALAPVGLRAALWEALHTKSGAAGVSMLSMLVIVSIAVPFYAPGDVIRSWTSSTKWLDNPREVPPDWIGVFTGTQPAKTIVLQPNSFRKAVVPSTVIDQTFVALNGTVSFPYDGFPSELSLSVWTYYGTQAPLLTVTWVRPDGEEVFLFDDSPRQNGSAPNEYRLSLRQYEEPFIKNVQTNIKRWIESKSVVNATQLATAEVLPEVTLFAEIDGNMIDPTAAKVLKGKYFLNVDMLGFNRSDDMDARFLTYGTVFGVAGTDNQRRDLLVGLLWGAPVALAFGTVAALVAVMIQTVLGVASGWYGGRLDEIVQRAADFFLIIPILPILILLSLFLRPDLVLILLVVVAFSIVGPTTKVVRSLAIQLKEEQFVEAARSYGASRGRILLRYMMPRVMPYAFALIALNVPAFIFLEASLSFLGLGNPSVPTWGGILGDAYRNAALYNDRWWWVVFPAGGILFTAVSFALLGYSLDKVLNPRLREE